MVPLRATAVPSLKKIDKVISNVPGWLELFEST